MEKEDLLLVLDIVNRHALTDPSSGGPQSDDEYAAVSRLNQKLLVALHGKGVKLREKKHELAMGILMLWHAEPGSRVDVKA